MVQTQCWVGIWIHSKYPPGINLGKLVYNKLGFRFSSSNIHSHAHYNNCQVSNLGLGFCRKARPSFTFFFQLLTPILLIVIYTCTFYCQCLFCLIAIVIMGVPMKFVIVFINDAYLVVGFKILAMERTFDCNFYCFYGTHQCERPSNDKGKHLSIVYYNMKDHQMTKVSIYQLSITIIL
jgi:hypothetical protein